MTELSTDKDHANVIAPAPVFYGAALITGQIINYFISIPLLPNAVAFALGIIVIAISIPIVLLAIFELRKAGTAFDARKPSTKGVVRREEIYMATKFGADYDQYKLKVRQWI